MSDTIYTMKWLRDNLGITAEMIRNYEEKGLMVKGANRNLINNYREYSKQQVEKLWAIKVLISIGFSTAEIKKFMKESCYDFETAISQKVEKLEKKMVESTEALEYAKTIKLTGLIPDVKTVGSMRFDEFIAYAKTEWNIFKEPQFRASAEIADILSRKSMDKMSPEELKKIAECFGQIDFETIINNCQIYAYCQVLVALKDLDYRDASVQAVVKVFFEYISKTAYLEYFNEELKFQWFTKAYIASFVHGDSAKKSQELYGKEGCVFIVNAIAYFGGRENVWKV